MENDAPRPRALELPGAESVISKRSILLRSHRAMTPLHIILTSIGTDGDVFPYVALGAMLRRRGHRATLAAGEGYRALAESNGLDFRPLVSREENEACFADADFWHPLKGPFVAARWGVAFLPRQYDLLAGLAGEGRIVFVASPGILAARVVQEKLGRPMASLILQPWMIRSSTAPPVMPGGFTLPRWAPRPVGALYWRGFDAAGAVLFGRPLGALRQRLGLAPVRRVFGWWMSPQRVIGMFPDWYGPPQPDWPPQIKLAGFPMYDGGGEARDRGGMPDELAEELSAFLAAGDPPVAFTFGTGMRHAAGLFRAAADACGRLKLRGLFLTKFGDQLPADLPPTIRHVSYAPFRQLLPRCAAVVHHGGVGTVAKSLAAGAPQLVLPVAFDQTDNAMRVKRLGAGDWLLAGKATGPRLAAALAGVLSPMARASSLEVAKRFDGADDALETAARHVEELGWREATRTSAGVDGT